MGGVCARSIGVSPCHVDFRRRRDWKVLISANLVEEVPDFIKRVLQAAWAVNLDLADERFDPTKEAFDVAVAPGGANRNALMTNADQLQEGLEHRTFEDQFVVSADGVADKGFADACWGMQPVESVSYFAAADLLAHPGLEAQDLSHNPFRLFARRAQP